MICTKCNSEVPNGAKFCPVCGNACGTASDVKPAAAPPEEETKTYCGKCGLELRRGAKFCAVCGAPASVGDVKISENDGSTFGRGEMSAVSLNKPNASDSLVAAMNTAAPSAVPAPSNSVPTPSNGIPMPSNNSGSGFSSGFGGSGFGSSAPSFIPESPANPFGSSENPFGDMGAAAIVATPIKKRTGLKVGIIIAAVVAVLVAAAAIFFFTNKATALSLIMGKSNYAAMVEGNSIKDAAEKLDVPALSDGIKSASGLAASLSSVKGRTIKVGGEDYHPGMINSNTEKATPADMISVSSGSADIKAIISSYYQMMMDTYGMNSVSATININTQISDSVKSMLGEDADEIIDAINGLNFSTDITVTQDAMAAEIGANSGSAVVNAKTIFTADGDFYLVFPFVGDKALKIKMPTENVVQTEDLKPLELDEKEIERIIGELVELYVNEYKNGAIEMGDGDLSAAGLTATGKLITAEFSGEKLAALFGKLAEHFANDEYFRTKIIEFANEYGAELTEQEYKDEIMSAFDPEDFDAGDKLVINTVIDNNGNVLAKSWKAFDGDDEVFVVTYVDSKEKFTFEASSSDGDAFTVVCDVVSDKEGTVTVRGSDDVEGTFGITVNYSNIEKAKFCGKDTFVGNYTVGLELPAELAEDEGFDASLLSGIKFTVSNKVSGENTMESTIGASLGNYGSVTLNTAVSAKNVSGALALPTDVIDLGNGENQLDEAAMKAMEDYLVQVGKKLEEMKDGPFGFIYDSISGDIPGNSGVPGTTGGDVTFDDVMSLTGMITQLSSDVTGYAAKYGVNDDALYNRALEIQSDLLDMYDEIVEKDFELTAKEFADFTREYDAIAAEAEKLENEYNKAPRPENPNTPSTPVNPIGSSINDLDLDSMTETELTEVLTEYESRYISIFDNYDYDRLYSDEAIVSLIDTADAACDKAVDDYVQFIESYVGGNYSVALLRNLRKSTKAFAVAVEELEKALMSQA